MHFTLSISAVLTALFSFSNYASAGNLYTRGNLYANGQDVSALHPQGSTQQNIHTHHQQVFLGASSKFNDISAERKLAIYARALDMDVEELVARGKFMDRVMNVGKKATAIAGKAAGFLGKASDIGQKLFGREEAAAAWEAYSTYLAVRDAEAEPEPELWSDNEGDFYGWDS